MLGILSIAIVVLLLFGSVPVWAYSRNWGYRPLSGFGLILLILLVLMLMGQI